MKSKNMDLIKEAEKEIKTGNGFQNDRVFDITIPVPIPTKADILKDSGVPGKGLENAPGLQKEFNPNSAASEHAGKRK